MNENITYSRLTSKSFERDAAALGAEVKDAWVIKVGAGLRALWEFHYGEFYDCFKADNAYEARSKGWNNWINSVRHAA